MIDPPDPENAGKVPVGQPSSGQSKEELATMLGLNGEAIGILEVNNGIVVKMDAQEAERWRQDVRVLHVNQSMEGSFMAVNDSQRDYPAYRDGFLILPRVDTDEQIGLFQNGVFQYDALTDAWHLVEFQTTPAPKIFLVEGDGVKAIVTDTLPVQVFC